MAAIRRLLCTSCCILASRSRSIRPGPLIWRISYFQIVTIDDSDLFCRAFVSFITCAYLSRRVLQGIFAHNISFGGSALRWTEMTIHFQQMYFFVHLSFGLLLFRLAPCSLVDLTHSAEKQRHSRVGDYCCLSTLFCQKTIKNETIRNPYAKH